MIGYKQFKTAIQFHPTLNKKLWDDFFLKRKVRSKLLKIADMFIEFSKIPNSQIKDIILVGGNANYNYTSFSDIDVHIVLDFDSIDNGTIDLDDYYRAKKELWSLTHNISVLGYTVELYVQNIKESSPTLQGVYSILKDKWITKPSAVSVDYQDKNVIKKVNHFITIINNFINHKVDDVMVLKDFKKRLRRYRSSGLQIGGEFSLENIVFKVLRNLGYLDTFDRYYKHIIDNSLSLK